MQLQVVHRVRRQHPLDDGRPFAHEDRSPFKPMNGCAGRPTILKVMLAASWKVRGRQAL
jgi:hypothetical protein